MVVGVIIGSLLVVAALGVLYQIMKQQGRMLLRLDELERAVAEVRGGHPAAAVGPPVGSALEPFAVTDLEGREVTLSRFGGRKALLVNWSPTCGYCDAIAPELADLRPALDDAKVALALMAHGDRETNRASAERYGLASAVYLLGENANPAGFKGVGTPAGILVDESGKVASPLAIGADKVPVLARDAAAAAPGNGSRTKRLRGQRPLTESRLVRDGLKAGTPAPPFELPDVYGSMVSLAAFRGRRVLLVFSDPECGPCDALAPHLVAAATPPSGEPVAVLLVTRGDVGENRRKAETHGFRFPVVVQDGWKLSKSYGIFATPVAYLIDEQGIIMRPVAKGVDEILHLMADVAT